MKKLGFLPAIMLALLGLSANSASAAVVCPQNFTGTVWNQFEPENYNSGGTTGSWGWFAPEGYWTVKTNTNNTNDNTNVPTCAQSGCMTFNFTIAAGDVGYYKIEAYVRAPNGNSNSFFVGLSGRNDNCSGSPGGAGNSSSGNPAIRRWDIATDNNFQWRYVTDWNQNNSAGRARVWYLTAGSYTLEFRGREDGTLLGKVHFMRLLDVAATPTPTFTPTFIPTPACAPNTSMGNINAGGAALAVNGNIHYTRLSPTTAGAASGMYFYTWGAATPNQRIRVALYADNAAVPRPANLITESLPVYMRQSVGWTYLPFTTTPQVVAGTYYWLSFQTAAADALAVYTAATGFPYYYQTGFTFAPFPATSTAAVNTGLTNRKWDAYVVVCGGTPTPTPTNTPTPTPIVGGLPVYKRLYGLEYIPFPEVTSGANIFYPLQLTTVATAALSQTARNTARWRIELQSLSQTGLSEVSIETRLGVPGQTCTSGYFNPAANLTATALTLPPRPQNISTTYMWVNAEVPITERFDAMGDPRFVPYIDVLGIAGETFPNNYNWFFANLVNAGNIEGDGYRPFVPMAQWNKTNPDVTARAGTANTLFGCNIDVPKLFALWREGVVKERAVFNNMAGVSSFYIGTGGQIGGESFNNLATGLALDGDPWNSAATGAAGNGTAAYKVCEIIGNGWKATNTNGTYIVTGGSGSAATWKSMPWLGELWPDTHYYSDWSATGSSTSWGNLNNMMSGAGNFLRSALRSLTFVSGSATYGFGNTTSCPGDYGSRTFMNNTTAPAFGHLDGGGNVAAMTDALTMGIDYNMAVANPAACSRPWKISAVSNGTGGSPVVGDSFERAYAPFSATASSRMTLQLYSGRNGAADATKGFYEYTGAGSAADSRTSGALRGLIGANDAGFFVISGLAPGATASYSVLCRFNVVAALRTYLDAGTPTRTAGANPFSNANLNGAVSLRIPPPPRVEFTAPKVGENLQGRTTIALAWKERYARWDGARYTENYPCLDDNVGNMNNPLTGSPCAGAADTLRPGNPANEWHDNEPLFFNLKYSPNGGGDWYSMVTNEVAEAGTRMEGANEVAMVANSNYTYSWNVTGFTEGSYLIRVECYRRNIGSHYSFHEISVGLKP